MTIIAKGTIGEPSILGYINYDISAYSVGERFQLNCTYDICNEDLFPILINSDESNWYITWKLIFTPGSTLINPNRYQGVLPTYNYGSWAFTYLGLQTFQDWINFSSQISPVAQTNALAEIQNYPQSWVAPHVPAGTPLLVDSFNNVAARGNPLGDTAHIQITGCTMEGASMLAYYYAQFQNSSYKIVWGTF